MEFDRLDIREQIGVSLELDTDGHFSDRMSEIWEIFFLRETLSIENGSSTLNLFGKLLGEGPRSPSNSPGNINPFPDLVCELAKERLKEMSELVMSISLLISETK